MQAHQVKLASGRSGRRVRERGQATVLLLAVVALVLVAMVATARFGARVVAKEQAQVAADAAALAGVEGGQAAARRVAVANHGLLLGFLGDGETVLVVVRVGTEVATAKAKRAP
jgi:hypothetical protein